MARGIKGFFGWIIVFLLISMILYGIGAVITEKVGGEIRNTVEIVNEEAWSTTFGGESYEFGSAIIQTTDGGYALAGSTSSYGTGTQDMWVIKTDINGHVEWNQSYGGDRVDYCTDIVQTKDGGFLFGGYTESTSNCSCNTGIWLIKTDMNGSLEWNQFYYDFDWYFFPPIFGFSIVQTSTGEIVLYSSAILPVDGGPGFSAGILLIKADINGSVIWYQIYEEEGHNIGACDLLQTLDEGFVLAGWINFNKEDLPDMYLMKTDANGTLQWNQTYGGRESEGAEDCIQTIDGGFALAGTTNSSGDYDMWLVKTDENGVFQWSQTYGSPRDDDARALLQTVGGEFILGGRSYTNNNYDIYLVKTDPTGYHLGSKLYGGSKDESLGGFLQISNNTFLLIGSTFSYGAGQSDIWLINTGPITFSRGSVGLNILPLLAALPVLICARRKKGVIKR